MDGVKVEVWDGVLMDTVERTERNGTGVRLKDYTIGGSMELKHWRWDMGPTHLFVGRGSLALVKTFGLQQAAIPPRIGERRGTWKPLPAEDRVGETAPASCGEHK